MSINMLPCILLIAFGIASFILFLILGIKGKMPARKPKIIDLLAAIIIPPVLFVFDRLINTGTILIMLINIGVGIAWGHTIANIFFWQLKYKRKKHK